MQKQKGIASIILIIIIIALLAVAGFFAYGYFSRTPNSQLPISQVNSSSSSTNTGTYSFNSVEINHDADQKYSSRYYYDVEIFRNGKLLKIVNLEYNLQNEIYSYSLNKPTLFTVSPDKKYVAFKTVIWGGSCVGIESPMAIDLNNFSIVKFDNSDINKKISLAVGVDVNKVIGFSNTWQKLSDIKWISDNQIESSMVLGDKDPNGCYFTWDGKSANIPSGAEAKVDFTIIK
jgi:hypothetical protein